MKNLVKSVVSIIVCALLLTSLLPQWVFAGELEEYDEEHPLIASQELQWWQSGPNPANGRYQIGRRHQTFNTFVHLRNLPCRPKSVSFATTRMQNAINAWSSALSYDIILHVDSPMNLGNTTVYNASAETISEWDDLYNGMAQCVIVNSTRYPNHFSHQGISIDYFVIRSAVIYISGRGWWGTLYWQNAYTHELGHALGWYNHSSNLFHVMRATSSTNTALRLAERRHLSQIYD